MATGPWSRKIEERLRTYNQRLEAVFKMSAQNVVRGMTTPRAKGGRMRVRTGFLRSSLMGSTATMPLINPTSRPPLKTPDNTYDFSLGPISGVIVSARLSDTIYLGFTAAYAAPREHFDGFIEAETQKWQGYVAANVARARAAFP